VGGQETKAARLIRPSPPVFTYLRLQRSDGPASFRRNANPAENLRLSAAIQTARKASTRQANTLPPAHVGPHNAVVGLAQQFGHPSGLLGAVVGRGMARGNADLSKWVVQQASAHHGDVVRRVVELGPGPGVGLEALLAQFPDAQVCGIDPSSVMLSQSRKRNKVAVTAGRLTLLEGDVSVLSANEPADIVMANHVLYFWQDPAAEMARIRGFLRPGGLLALGYQLKQNMPAMAQRRFPPAGHHLYEADDEVSQLAITAGFGSVTHLVKGSAEAPEGRAMLATT
jgi:SAM-dependent methyltransferase